MLHYIILYCIPLYSIVFCCILLYYIVLYRIILYYIVLYGIILYYIVLYYIMLCLVGHCLTGKVRSPGCQAAVARVRLVGSEEPKKNDLISARMMLAALAQQMLSAE